MAQYSHKVNNFHRSQLAKRLRVLSLFVTIILVIGAGFVSVDWLLGRLSSSNTIVSTATTTSVQSATISLYRTPYFQFQASDKWSALESQSNDKKFIYVKNDSQGLATQQLTVYIDRPYLDTEADLSLTNAIAVNLNDEGGFSDISEPSAHCRESWPSNTRGNPARIIHAQVSFVCSPGSYAYNVVVGAYGGNEILEMKKPDGSRIKITIILSDLTAYPSSGDLRSILSSFIVL